VRWGGLKARQCCKWRREGEEREREERGRREGRREAMARLLVFKYLEAYMREN
jgi:hypothetical protein